MGNAWTPRRSSDGRPQVCKPPPPPPPLGITVTCTIVPTEAFTDPFSSVPFEFQATDPTLPDLEEFAISWIPSGGDIEGPELLQNGAPGEYQWNSNGDDGTFLQIMTALTSKNQECVKSLNIEVQPEEEP